jgi:hypothetical protein
MRMRLLSVSKVRASLLIVGLLGMAPPTYALANCPLTVTGVSDSGCTRFECYFDYGIEELRTHRTTCYYTNCTIITISPCV